MTCIEQGTVILTTWWDTPAKSCQIIFLKMFAKNFFQSFSCEVAFLEILKHTLFVLITQWPKKKLIDFCIWVLNNAKFYADFNYVEIIGNKCIRRKLLAENFSKLVIEKRANSKFRDFLISNFLAFFSTVWNQHKILRFLNIFYSNFPLKCFYVILALFWSPIRKNGSKYWKTYYIIL